MNLTPNRPDNPVELVKSGVHFDLRYGVVKSGISRFTSSQKRTYPPLGAKVISGEI